MRKLSLFILIGSVVLPCAALAQTPAAAPAGGGTGAGRVAVVDFQKAVTENAEGKKAQERFMAELNKRQKDFEDKQKSMTDMQTKMQNGDKALSDPAKADLAKQIDKLNTELQRMNDDAQKDLGELQQQLFRPIAEKTQEIVKSYSKDNGFDVVFDVSQGNSILYWQDVADITTEIIRRVDSTPSKPAGATSGATTPAPTPKAAEPPKK
jgi:outer membrane protein